MSSINKTIKRNITPRSLIFERLMVLIASANLILVVFDLSYVPWRDFWLRVLPRINSGNTQSVITFYDRVKGIEVHRDTEEYLNRINALEEQVAQTGLQSTQSALLLQEIRTLSENMIDDNPFAVADKSGMLEKIKNRMRDRISQTTKTKVNSSKQAFSIFWSQNYLSQAGWGQELRFFNLNIRPLIRTNYYRPIGENGEPVNWFWLIDLPFIGLFGLEFLGRTFIINRRHSSLSWPEAMLWRWYDIFLLLPFWRWLRIIPVIIRLGQAELLNLEPVKTQINRGFVANFAGELTQIVVLRILSQTQSIIRSGEIGRWLSGRVQERAYIDINNTNEVEAIAKVLINLTVYQVIPKIQPDIEAIIRHNIERALNQLPVYQGMQKIPGLGQLPHDLIERLSKEITTTTYNAIAAVLEDDPVGTQLTNDLIHNFSEVIKSELQRNQTIEKVQSLLLDMLEEIKLNYVESYSEAEFEQILQQTTEFKAKKLPSD